MHLTRFGLLIYAISLIIDRKFNNIQLLYSRCDLTMAETGRITQENFDLLLTWLGTDPESAAQKYEKIRERLIRVFVGRGCHEAEALADKTIDRVTFKLPEIVANYVGDPTPYFHGVAGLIYLEWIKLQKPHVTTSTVDAAVTYDCGEREAEYECLERCLAKLETKASKLIVDYYRGEKSAKIEQRKQMAESLGITVSALHMKMSRVRSQLLGCVRECVG